MVLDSVEFSLAIDRILGKEITIYAELCKHVFTTPLTHYKSWGKIAEQHRQWRSTGKNPGGGDEDPNQKREVELYQPQGKETT